MGKGATAKRATRRVKMAITNYEIQTARLKRSFVFFAFLCACFMLFAVNSFAQTDLELYFIQKLKIGSIEEKRSVLMQLRNFKTEEASLIAVPALRDKSEIVRATAAFSVIFLPKGEASNALIPLLNDKKELVRREAAYALGKVRNPNAINPLLQILQKDKILEVRAASAIALGEIGDVSAADELGKILQKKPKDEEEFLRRSAARSIGQIAQIIQTGEMEVLSPESFLPDKFNPIEKPKYLNLLEAFPIFRTANSILIATLQNPREFDDVKREVAFALGAIGDESSISVLRANLNAKNYYLAKICEEGLRKIQFIQALKKAEQMSSVVSNKITAKKTFSLP